MFIEPAIYSYTLGTRVHGSATKSGQAGGYHSKNSSSGGRRKSGSFICIKRISEIHKFMYGMIS